jgi:hypothetical protein
LLQILTFLAVGLLVGAGVVRDAQAFLVQPVEHHLRILRPVHLEIGFAEILERAAIVRVQSQRLIVELERAPIIAELPIGEARQVVGLVLPRPLLDHPAHVLDHALPVLLLEGRDPGREVVRARRRRRRVATTAHDRPGRCRWPRRQKGQQGEALQRSHRFLQLRAAAFYTRSAATGRLAAVARRPGSGDGPCTS